MGFHFLASWVYRMAVLTMHCIYSVHSWCLYMPTHIWLSKCSLPCVIWFLLGQTATSVYIYILLQPAKIIGPFSHTASWLVLMFYLFLFFTPVLRPDLIIHVWVRTVLLTVLVI